MNSKIVIEGGVAVLLAIAVVGFASTAPAGHGATGEAGVVPAFNQDAGQDATDNSRECASGAPDVACVYL